MKNFQKNFERDHMIYMVKEQLLQKCLSKSDSSMEIIDDSSIFYQYLGDEEMLLD